MPCYDHSDLPEWAYIGDGLDKEFMTPYMSEDLVQSYQEDFRRTTGRSHFSEERFGVHKASLQEGGYKTTEGSKRPRHAREGDSHPGRHTARKSRGTSSDSQGPSEQAPEPTPIMVDWHSDSACEPTDWSTAKVLVEGSSFRYPDSGFPYQIRGTVNQRNTYSTAGIFFNEAALVSLDAGCGSETGLRSLVRGAAAKFQNQTPTQRQALSSRWQPPMPPSLSKDAENAFADNSIKTNFLEQVEAQADAIGQLYETLKPSPTA